MNQIQRERAYANGWRVSTVLRDLLTPRMTVRRHYTQQANGSSGDTLFWEVKALPFERVMTDADRALFALPPGTVQEDRPSLFARLYAALCEHIKAAWKPGMHHIVLMSSGWDSRVLSWTLRQLAFALGVAWLGDVLFVSYGPEAEIAEQVLGYEGWAREQMLLMTDPADWLWPILMPSLLAPSLNGMHPLIPVTRHWIVRQACERVGWAREDTQVLSGFGSDYALAGAGREDMAGKVKDGYGASTAIPMRSVQDEILPWMGRGVLKVARESSVRHAFDLRRDMAGWLDARLGAFPRLEHKWPDFPEDAQERARRWFAKSWYARQCGGKLKHIVSNWSAGAPGDACSSTWCHWTAAVYCQDLIENGYGLEAG